MIEHLAAEVRAAWDTIAPGRTPPRRLHVAKWSLENAPAAESPLVFFVFAPDAPTPVAMAKAARVAATDASLAREFEMLTLAHARLPAALARVVPRPLAAGTCNARQYFVATIVPGRIEPDLALAAVRGRDATLRAALGWALDVVAATPAPPITLAEWIPWVRDPEATLANLGAAADLRRVLAPHLPAIWEQAWPAALSHGDFFAGNILLDDDDRCSGVVDWSLASERGPIAHDVLTYEFSLGVAAVRAGGSWSLDLRDRVAALPGFAASRRQLQERGVGCDPGSGARIANLVGAILRDEKLAPGRDRTRAAQLALLAIELRSR